MTYLLKFEPPQSVIGLLAACQPESITPKKAVANGALFLTKLTDDYRSDLPFGSDWAASLVGHNGDLLFDMSKRGKDLASLLCRTWRGDDPYSEALAILGITEGWKVGLDVPPPPNRHFYPRDPNLCEDEQDATLLYKQAQLALNAAWHARLNPQQRKRHTSTIEETLAALTRH